MKLDKPMINLHLSSDPVLPTKQEMDHVIQRVEHSLAIPQTGGLTPNPLIREHLAQRLQQHKPHKRHPLRALMALLTMRIPVYQAAFGMVVVLFAFMATERPHLNTSSNTPSLNTEQLSANTPHQAPNTGIALIDSLAQIRASVSDTAFITSPVDSL